MNKRGLFKFLFLTSALIFGLVLSAQALTDVTPSNCLLNPVNQALYAVDNSNLKINFYKYDSTSASWNNNGYPAVTLPAKTYGMAVSPDGNTLYVSVNAGANSKVTAYSLDASGYLVTGSTDMTGAAWSTYSSPAGMAADGLWNLYLVDKQIGRIRIFNTSSNSWVSDFYDILAGKTNLSSIALTPVVYKVPLIPSYKIYVARKAAPGAIYVFDYNNGSITYNKTITGLDSPTSMKVVGGKLFVAVNGTDGVDVKVYDTSDDHLVGNVKSGVIGSYGWTAMDVTPDSSFLYFKKALNAGESSNKLYKIPVYAISGDVNGTEVMNEQGIPSHLTIIKSDGMAVSSDKHGLVLTDSFSGNLQNISIATTNRTPDGPVSLQQYKMDGTTVIPVGGHTSEQHIIVQFSLTDWDGDMVRPTVMYKKVSDTQYTSIVGTYVPSGSVVTMEVPAPADAFAPGNYEWMVYSTDSNGFDSGVQSFNGNTNITDFTVDDTVPPGSISDLAATPGTSPGDVNITWTAPGDNGMTGTVSGYKVRYMTSIGQPIADPFSFGFTDSRAQDYTPTTPWTSLVPGGGHESRTLHNLPTSAGQTVYIYIAIEAFDGAAPPNYSPMSNVASSFVPDHNPSPTVTMIYPSSAPINTDQTVSIEGTDFISGASVKLIQGATIINAPTVVVTSLTTIKATFNTGSVTGKYNVVVTNQDGKNGTLPDGFTVTSGPDSTASQIANFLASDGENAKSTLTWKNPSDNDMAEIKVMRKGPFALPINPANYPASNTDGTQVNPTGVIPRPGDSVTLPDAPLTNDQVYYYTAFIRDTSGNWSAVQIGQNADTATPSSNPVTTISNTSIARDADALNSSVSVTWQSGPSTHAAVDIYTLEKPAGQVLTKADFSTAANWTKAVNPAIISVGNLDKFTDANQVGNGNQKYYKIVPQGKALIDTDLATEVAGKFDLSVGPEPEKLFISLPVKPSDASLAAVVGGQAAELDMIVSFDINKQAQQGSMLQGGSWVILPGAGASLDTLDMGYGYGYITQTARYISVVGRVKENQYNRNLTGNSTANWIASPYPYSYGVANAGLNATSANSDPTKAAMTVHFDANAEAIGGTDGIAFHYAASEWREGTLQSQSPMVITPGMSYMLLEPGTSDVAWTINR